jgi:hypothetical protein
MVFALQRIRDIALEFCTTKQYYYHYFAKIKLLRSRFDVHYGGGDIRTYVDRWCNYKAMTSSSLNDIDSWLFS